MKRAAPWLIAGAPLAVGAAVAGVMLALDESRSLQVGMDLPLVALSCGALLTAAGLWFVGNRATRRREARARSTALQAAERAGAEREREQHRRFLARLDHELKNPVMAIRAQAAASDSTTAWRTVDAQAAKMSALVQDLRKLAELETRTLEREQVDLEALLSESITALEQQHPDAAGRFALSVTRVPWPVPVIDADVDLLSLAVDNVLGNAAKYSSTGPIEVRLREQEGWAVVEVADSGRGVPADDLPSVFDELARAGNARDVAGSGIGLTLVATVLRRHDGDVSMRSLAGSGTVVTMRMPLR